MPWLAVDYFPGFAEDLTSWTIEIERDGRFLQTVKPPGFHRRKSKLIQRHKLTLSRDQIAELERLLAAIDLSAAVDELRRLCIEDAERVAICIDTAPDLAICGPLTSWSLDSKAWLRCPALSRAVDLWRAIDILAPRREVC